MKPIAKQAASFFYTCVTLTLVFSLAAEPALSQSMQKDREIRARTDELATHSIGFERVETHGTTNGNPVDPHTPATDKSSYSANWIRNLLPPPGTAHQNFDESLLEWLEVLICAPQADGSCTIVDTLTYAEGEIMLTGNGDHGAYRIHWGPPAGSTGTLLEVRVSVAGLTVDTFEYLPTSSSPKQIRFMINDHPRIRAHALRVQGAVADQAAAALIDEFDLGSLEIARLLHAEGYKAEEVGTVLRDTFNETPADAAWLMRAAGIAADDVANALTNVFFQTADDTAWILRAVGYSCFEIDQALRSLFGDDPQAVFHALMPVGCAPDPVTCDPPEDAGGRELEFRTMIVDSFSGVLDLRFPGTGVGPVGFDRSLLDELLITVEQVMSDGSLSLVSTHNAGSAQDAIRRHFAFYKLDWRPDLGHVGKTFRMTVSVAGLNLAFDEFHVDTTSTVPVMFRIDNHPVIRARVLRNTGATATEIVQQLLGEFGSQPGEIARILFEEAIPALELGEGLRDGLPGGAAEVTQALIDGGLSSTLALTILDGVFNLTGQASIPILRVAGYSASDVWEALDVVLDWNDSTIEKELKAGGYTDEEILVALAPRLLIKYACLIDRNGPRVYFHDNEPYMPSSIDWYIERSALVWGQFNYMGGEDITVGRLETPHDLTPENLVDRVAEIRGANAGWDFWLDPPDVSCSIDANGCPAGSAFGGNLASTEMYVHAVRLRDLDKTDLQFWLFYPYNGPGSMDIRSDLFGLGNICLGDDFGNTAPLGEHESDWEVVVLRFDDITNDLEEVYLSSHGDYHRWIAGCSGPECIEVEAGDHVVAFAALNGHAMFAHEGRNPGQEKFVDLGPTGDIELNTLNYGERGSRFFDSWTSYEFIALDGAHLDKPWVGFDGRWGETIDFNLSHFDKVEIVYDIAEECYLQIVFIQIPVAAGFWSAAVCSPLLFIPFVGAGAYGSCVAGLFKTAVALAYAVLNPVTLFALSGEIIAQSGLGEIETGKPSPGSRGEEWRHFRIPNEKPRVIHSTDTGAPGDVVRRLVVSIPDQVCERKDPKYNLPAGICVDTPVIDRVEIGIDGVYTDITANTTANPGEYFFDWDTSGASGPQAALSPRYSNPQGFVFEYTDTMPLDTGMIPPGPSLQVALQNNVIGEGGSAVLDGMIETPPSPASPLEGAGSAQRAGSYTVMIAWGDGSMESLATMDAFSATHTYVENGNYTISVTVAGEPLAASEFLTVGNVAPSIDLLSQTSDVSAIEEAPVTVDASAEFSDPGVLDTHSITWDWGDGGMTSQDPVTSPAQARYTYNFRGVFVPSIVLTDDDGGSAEADFGPIVVSDPGETAGAGTILAPVVDTTEVSTPFTFDVTVDPMGMNPDVVNLEILAGNNVIGGVQNAVAVLSGNAVEVTGLADIDGNTMTSDGEPLEVWFRAVDGGPLPADDQFEARVWFVDSNGMEQTVYETSAAQPLDSGDIVVDAMGMTMGDGSIFGPDPAAFGNQEASFGFTVGEDAMGNSIVEFVFGVAGLLLEGVGNPVVDVMTGEIQIEGEVNVNGEPATGADTMTTADDFPFMIRITALDAAMAVDDTFEILVWFVDASNVIRTVYETEVGQTLVSGEVRVVSPPPPAPSSSSGPSRPDGTSSMMDE